MAMSREAGQGRGASSRGHQRSPEELAAVLARLADQAGDPKPRERSGSGRRRSGSPPRTPIADPPRARATKPERPATPEPTPKREPPPRPDPPPPVEPPPPLEPAAKSRPAPDAGSGLIVGTPINRAAGPEAASASGPRPAVTNSSTTGGARAIPKRRPPSIPKVRRGDRPGRAPKTPVAATRLRSRASGRIGGQPGSGRRQQTPIRLGGRTWPLVLVGLVVLVILLVVITSGGSSKHPAATTPIKPAAAHVATTPVTPASGVPTVTQDTTQQTTAQTTPAVTPAHKATAANKPHHAAAKHTAPSKPVSATGGAASTAASGNTTAATSPARSAAPYYRPAPPQPQPSSGSAGSSLGAAALLGHRHSHHKK